MYIIILRAKQICENNYLNYFKVTKNRKNPLEIKCYITKLSLNVKESSKGGLEGKKED